MVLFTCGIWSEFPTWKATENKCHERTLTLNVIRNKWCKDVSPVCNFCSSKYETMIHLFCDCILVSPLWGKLERLCLYFFHIQIKFDKSSILLNNVQGKHSDIINMFIIIWKQYIYASKCLNNIPTFQGFMLKVSEYYFIEKFQIATGMNRSSKMLKKWQCIF